MVLLAHRPLLLFVVSFVGLWLAAWVGAALFRRLRPEIDSQREDYGVVQSAVLTLLALIVGFTFSMAVTRYDQRKNLEEEEANAIGTEYLRVDMLPAADAQKARALLVAYLDQRILYYTTRNDQELARTIDRTAQLQNDLWSAVAPAARAQQTPVMTAVVMGMNDVLNSQGYTTAAWLNRIPDGAWDLLGAIAVCAMMVVGAGAHESRVRFALFMILPLVLSISLFMIADIDAPRRGVIRVMPMNLEILQQSLASH
ncbi:MAG TPA: hypothetical protein VMR86_08600 [Myxococcota bacterium]|nr:hypothetical protein [Myxococcota bacterium]